MRRFLAARSACLALGCALALSAAGRAQAPHPIPLPSRPLHERAAEAEAIALVAVERVERGRIGLRQRTTLRGELPGAFELKRSPLAPPALTEGDVALVMLRGARSPYVLAGTPSEVVSAASGDEQRALTHGVRALLAVDASPDALAALYRRWASSPLPALRDLGRVGVLAMSRSGLTQTTH